MKRSFILLLEMIVMTTILLACSNGSTTNNGEIESENTLDDQIAEEKNILSKDDAEVLVYKQLNN